MIFFNDPGYLWRDGADGTTTFTLKQDQTTGLKTELTAALDSSSSTKSTLPVVFTVLTSPDSPKAKFWGIWLKRRQAMTVLFIEGLC